MGSGWGRGIPRSSLPAPTAPAFPGARFMQPSLPWEMPYEGCPELIPECQAICSQPAMLRQSKQTIFWAFSGQWCFLKSLPLCSDTSGSCQNFKKVIRKENLETRARQTGECYTWIGSNRMGFGDGGNEPRCSLVLKQGFGTLTTVRSVKALQGWLFGRKV